MLPIPDIQCAKLAGLALYQVRPGPPQCCAYKHALADLQECAGYCLQRKLGGERQQPAGCISQHPSWTSNDCPAQFKQSKCYQNIFFMHPGPYASMVRDLHSCASGRRRSREPLALLTPETLLRHLVTRPNPRNSDMAKAPAFTQTHLAWAIAWAAAVVTRLATDGLQPEHATIGKGSRHRSRLGRPAKSVDPWQGQVKQV